MNMRLLLLTVVVALGAILQQGDVLAAETKCRAKELTAMQRYAKCLFRVGKKALRGGLGPSEIYERDAACAARLQKKLSRFAKKAACAGVVGTDAVELRDILEDNLLAARSRGMPPGSSYGCGAAPEDASTTRCVFTDSFLALDLATLIAAINLSDVDPADLAVTVEVYGAEGSDGNDRGDQNGGNGGKHGYASTTWSYETFIQNGTASLYGYVGTHPSCAGCGGSSSLVSFVPLEDDPGQENLLAVAGGGGGGGHAADSHYGGHGGAGGIAESTKASDTSGAGSPGIDSANTGNPTGGQGGDGQGGGGAAACGDGGSGDATPGADGLGGFGGVKATNSDSSRAGWAGSDSPSFSEWSAGAGGNGKNTNSLGGGGGGGYGGGGGGCNHQGAGGGGSWVRGTSFTGSKPSVCGSDKMPNASGTCGKGNHPGRIVINFKPDTP